MCRYLGANQYRKCLQGLMVGYICSHSMLVVAPNSPVYWRTFVKNPIAGEFITEVMCSGSLCPRMLLDLEALPVMLELELCSSDAILL